MCGAEDVIKACALQLAGKIEWELQAVSKQTPGMCCGLVKLERIVKLNLERKDQFAPYFSHLRS